MSESEAIIRRLLGQGLTGEQIGRAIGRDRSLVSQVGRGRKPGSNLAGALGELERRVNAGMTAEGIAEPARRTTSSGRVARVRRRTTVRSKSGEWASVTTKQQATRSGTALDKQLRRAASLGLQAAADATMDTSVEVRFAYGRNGVEGSGGTVSVSLDPHDYVESGMTPADYIAYRAAEEGQVEPGLGANVVTVELRVW